MKRRGFMKALAWLACTAAVKPISALGSTLDLKDIIWPVVEFNNLTSLPVGKWSHVAVSRGLDGYAHTYVNGKLLAVQNAFGKNPSAVMADAFKCAEAYGLLPNFENVDDYLASQACDVGTQEFTIEACCKMRC